MLTGIEFGLQIVWNVLMYDNFKYFGKGIENEDRALIIHCSILSYLKHGNNGSLLPECTENTPVS
jgi:hypothetical protein